MGNGNFNIPCKKCDTDFRMSFWRQFGRKWHQIWWKSTHCLSKCHENSMTWIYPKFMSFLAWKTDKTRTKPGHGMVMEFSVHLCIWTKLPSICDLKWHGISMRILVTFFTGSVGIFFQCFAWTFSQQVLRHSVTYLIIMMQFSAADSKNKNWKTNSVHFISIF